MAVTILIPTYNMAEHLRPLAESILEAGLLPQLREILFVDDGSSDDTPDILRELARDGRFAGKLRVLRLDPNRGRFGARFEGAKSAQSPWLLCLDSRVRTQPGFALNLQRVLRRGMATVGWIDTDVTKNIYCLYWQRSHETIFKRHYQIRQPLELNTENYDRFLKGTGVFACPTEHFLEICRALEALDVKSDDTLLIRELLEFGPIFVDPQLKVNWEPRDNLRDFLFRFFERGPGFVEYHVFQRPGKWAMAVLAGLFVVALWFGFGLKNPITAVLLAILFVPVAGLTAIPFGRTWRESLKLVPLHALVVVFFGLGVLYGLFVNMFKSMKYRPPKRP